jgi:PIN domain nuclease of toxin-antitoxin system
LEAISRADQPGSIATSSISVWETANLVTRGRVALSSEVQAWFATIAEIERVRFLAVDNAVALGAVNLPGEFHRDPADRFLVATARYHDLTLVTGDSAIRAYPHVRTIW